MPFLSWLFGPAEELPDYELEPDFLEADLPNGAMYEVDEQGFVTGVYIPGEEDPDDYDDTHDSTGFW